MIGVQVGLKGETERQWRHYFQDVFLLPCHQSSSDWRSQDTVVEIDDSLVCREKNNFGGAILEQ